MSESGPGTVGISQRIRLEWLEEAATLARSGHDRAQAWSALTEMLSGKVSVGGTAVRGNREKTVTILTRIWCRPPPRLLPLRDAGLRLLGAEEPTEVVASPTDRLLAVHWGMTMAVYPFWGAVATQVGRLLRLQGDATAAQVHRRVQEHYGQRPTVARATRRVVRSFVDWGVLADAETQGRYVVSEQSAVQSPAQAAWLMEASLHAHASESAPAQDLLRQPGLFPFGLPYLTARTLAAESPRLDVARQGLDTELLVLRPVESVGSQSREAATLT